MKKFHIISNPVAGKTHAAKNLKKVEEMLSSRGVAFETHLSQREKDATNIARNLTQAGETEIIVIGGDGTLHEVLNGITDISACNLGLIPSGTGNDFAEKLGVPYDVEEALEIIMSGEAKLTDCIEVGGVRCMNVCGLGMDVDVLERCQRGKMKGKLKYLWSLICSLFSFKEYGVEIESEGETQRHGVLIAAICNGGQFGGGIRICPVAEVDDGKLNVVVVKNPGGKMGIIKAFLKLMKGKVLDLDIATHWTCERVKITPEIPCTVQLDGELYKELDFDIKVCKGLHFYRP